MNADELFLPDPAEAILKKEKIKCEDDLVLALAKMANGSMRDGLSLLDRLISTGVAPLTVQLLEDFLGRPNAEKVQKLVEQIGAGDAAGTLTATEDLINTGLGFLFLGLQAVGYVLMGGSFKFTGSYDAAYLIFIFVDVAAAAVIITVKPSIWAQSGTPG